MARQAESKLSSNVMKGHTPRGWRLLAAVLVGALLAVAWPPTVRATAIGDVSPAELAGMQPLYKVDDGQFDFNDAYTFDNHLSIGTGSFTRVGYYVQLGTNWVWASMDTFNANPTMLGVPKAGTNIVENGTLVNNLHVETNAGSTVTPGTYAKGIIEFWASNYGPDGGGLYGSNNGNYDWKDSGGTTGGGHGSFQVFSLNATLTSGSTLFGITAGGGSGIGDQPGGGNSPDWTFGPGTGTYAVRNLEIWVGTPIPPGILTWDGLGNGNWDTAHWTGANPPPPPTWPDKTIQAVVNSDTVTVANNQAAYLLTVNGGGVSIASGATLTLTGALTVSPGGVLSLQSGGTLAAASGTVDSLKTGGSSTLSATGTLSVTTFNDQGVAGTLLKQGAGTLALDNTSGTGVLAGATTFNVAAGTLKAAGLNPLGTGVQASPKVTLSGGTLEVQGAATTLTGLRHYGYHINNDGLVRDLNNNAGMMGGGDPTTFQNYHGQGLLTDGPRGIGFSYQSDADFAWDGAIGQADNYSNLWLGMLHVTAANAGTWTFRTTRQDDGTGFWIDLNQNGVFNSSTPGLGTNRGEQVAYNDNGNSRTVSLTPGDYMVAWTHVEGGGGSQAEYQFQSPTMGALAIIKPSDPAQAGLWFVNAHGAISMSTTQVDVTASSTLRAVTDVGATFGPLTLGAGTTLTTAGGPMTFASIMPTGGGGGRTITLNALNSVTTPSYSDGGVATNYVQTGSGTVTLPSVSAVPTSTFRVNGGTLAATAPNPLGQATSLILGGGTYDVTTSQTGMASNAIRGSIFLATTSGSVNLDGASYAISASRVFTGTQGVLGMAEDPNRNVMATGLIQNWNAWLPAFDGNIDNFVTALSGQFTPTVTGNYNFRWSNDDRGVMYIDMLNDGVFDASDRLAAIGWDGNGTRNLTAGTPYNFMYMAGEDGGGQSLNFWMTPPAGGEVRVNTLDPAQAGMWSALGLAHIDMSATDVTVIPNTTGSTINARTDGGITFGTLGIGEGASLALSGSHATFASTAFGAGSTLTVGGNGVTLGPTTTSGNANLGGTGRAVPTTYNDQGVAGTMRIYGGATLVLDNTVPGTVVANHTIFEVDSGATLDATGALPLGAGTTTVNLVSGTLIARPVPANSALSTPNTSINVSFNNALYLPANATINVPTTNASGAAFGPLTFTTGNTLTTTGAPVMSFASTTVTAPVAAGFIPAASTRTYTGPLNGSSLSNVIYNVGPGDLVLNQPGQNLASTTLEARGGRTVVVGTAPITGATLTVAGGEFVFATPTAGQDLTIPNPITAYRSGTLTAGTGGIAPVGHKVILSSLLPTDGAVVTLRDQESCFVLPNGIDGLGSSLITQNALAHYGYNARNDGVFADLNNNGGMFNSGKPSGFQNFFGRGLLTSGPRNGGLLFQSDADFINEGVVGVSDNYSDVWTGILHVSAAQAGTWTFRTAGQDDGCGMWIDSNGNGVFESSTAGLGSNRGEQLSWADGTARSVTLAAGDYRVAFTHVEGGGGSYADIRFTPPGGSEAIIKPSDPAQAGLWSVVVAPGGLDIAQGQTITYGALKLGSLAISGGDLIRNGADVAGGSRNITVTDSLTIGGGKNLAMTNGQILTTTGATVTINAGSTLWTDQAVNAANLNIFGDLVRIPTGAGNITVAKSLTLNSTLDMTPGGTLTTAGADIAIGSKGNLIAAAPLVAKSLTTAGNVTAPGATLTSLLLTGGTTTLKGDTTVTSEIKGGGATLATQGNMTLNASTASLVNFSGQLKVQSGNLALNLPGSGVGGSLPSGLILDLDARAFIGVANGARVASWADLSGLGHDANNAVGNPLYTASSLNGQPAVKFYASDGTDYLYTTYNFDAAQIGSAYSIFSVDRYTGGANNRIVSSMDHNYLFGHHGGGDGRWYAEGWITPAGGDASTTWHVYGGTMNSSNQGNFWKDGTQTATNSTGANGGNHNPGRLELGAWQGGNEASNGEVGEVLIFNRALTAAEANAVSSYLASRFGVAGPPAAAFANASLLGDLQMAPSTQVSLVGGPAKFTSIAATGGLSVAGPMTVAGGGSVAINAPANLMTLSGGVNADNFNVTGTGTITINQNLTLASGAAFNVPATAALRTTNSLTIDASSASVVYKGGLNVTSGTLTLNTPAPIATPASAMAYWGLNEASGTTVSDSSGNSRSGTFVNSLVWVPQGGIIGGALQFNDTNAYVAVSRATNGGINIDNQSFSLSAWVKLSPTAVASDYWFGQGISNDPTSNTDKVLHVGRRDVNNATMAFFADDLNYTNPAVVSDSANWHQYVMTFDATTKTQSIWIDGKLGSSRTTNGGAPPNGNNGLFAAGGSTDFWLGQANNGNWFSGLLDEAAVYGRVLSTADIQLLYRAGLNGGYGAVGFGNLTMAAGTNLILGGTGQAAFDSIAAANGTSIQGSVTLRGPLTVGNSLGTLNINGNLAAAPGANYIWEPQYDWTGNVPLSDVVNVSGTLDLTQDSTLTINPLGVLKSGQSYNLFTYGTLLLGGNVTLARGTSAYADLVNLGACTPDLSTPNTFALNIATTPAAEWRSAGDTNWNVAGNWKDGVLPSALNAAVVNTNVAVATITAGMGTQKANTLIVDGGRALIAAGANLQVTDDTVMKNAWVEPTGQLTVLGILGAAQLTTAGTTTFGSDAVLNIAKISVTGGTTTGGPGTTLPAGTSLALNGGTLAGTFTSLNPSTTAGTYAYEILSGVATAALRGDTASLHVPSTAGTSTISGPVTLNTMSVEGGTTTLADSEPLKLNGLSVSGGSLNINRPAQVGDASFSGGTTTTTRGITVTSGLRGAGTFVSDGSQVMDLTAAAIVNFSGTLHVGSSNPANSADLLVNLPATSMGQLVYQNFDVPGTAYTARNEAGTPLSIVNQGPPNNNFMRLLSNVTGTANQIAFDRTLPGPQSTIRATFDMRFSNTVNGADGGAFVLLPTATYGTSGTGPNGPNGAWEEPNLAGTFGVGFDIYPGLNEVSLHWNGVNVANSSVYDYREKGWESVSVNIDYAVGGAYVSVGIAGNPIYTNYWIAGMTPYESRALFGARTGGLAHTLDVDNIDIRTGQATPALGDVRLDSPARLTLGGFGVAAFTSIGATGGVTATGPFTAAPSAVNPVPTFTSSNAQSLTLNASLTGSNFRITNPGTVTLTDNLAVASGGFFSVARNATLATRGSNIVIDAPNASFDVKGTINVASGTLTVNMPAVGGSMPSGLQAWYDASTLGLASGASVATWNDRSGNGRTATYGAGSVTFATDQIDGNPAVLFRAGSLNINSGMQATEQYFVFRSGNGATFGPDWGAVLGRQDGVSWMFQGNTTNTWDQHRPQAINENGAAMPTAGPLTNVGQYMVMKVSTNADNTGTPTYYLGRNGGWGNDNLDVAEVLAFNHNLTAAEENNLGGYLAAKYGISTAYTGYIGARSLGSLQMAPGTHLILGGSSQAAFDSITSGDQARITGNALVNNLLDPTGRLTIEGNLEVADGMIYKFNLTPAPMDLITADNITIDKSFTLQLFGAGATIEPSDKVRIFELTAGGQLSVNGIAYGQPGFSLSDVNAAIQFANLDDPYFQYNWDTCDTRLEADSEGLYLTGLTAELVPEPTSLALLALGGLALLRRRRRNRAKA